jgi:hypothetical protein
MPLALMPVVEQFPEPVFQTPAGRGACRSRTIRGTPTVHFGSSRQTPKFIGHLILKSEIEEIT